VNFGDILYPLDWSLCLDDDLWNSKLNHQISKLFSSLEKVLEISVEKLLVEIKKGRKK